MNRSEGEAICGRVTEWLRARGVTVAAVYLRVGPAGLYVVSVEAAGPPQSVEALPADLLSGLAVSVLWKELSWTQ